MVMVCFVEDIYYQCYWVGSCLVVVVVVGMGCSMLCYSICMELFVGGSSIESMVLCSLDSCSMRLVFFDEGCMFGYDLVQGCYMGLWEKQMKRSYVL